MIKKKRAPQDLTLRNLRASVKRLLKLDRRITKLETTAEQRRGQEARIQHLERMERRRLQ